jgi:hypothetical protein
METNVLMVPRVPKIHECNMYMMRRKPAYTFTLISCDKLYTYVIAPDVKGYCLFKFATPCAGHVEPWYYDLNTFEPVGNFDTPSLACDHVRDNILDLLA